MDIKPCEVTIYISQTVKGPQREYGIWGYVLEYQMNSGKVVTTKEFGEEKDITAHELELVAILFSLQRLNRRCVVILHSVHGFFKNVIANHWLENWERDNWKNAKGKDIANQGTWKAINTELDKHSVIAADKNMHKYGAELEMELNKMKKRKKEEKKYGII